jgi:hypothetical protein
VRLITAVPVALQRIIEKAMKKERELRYNRAAELRTDLKRFKRDSRSGSYRIEAEMPARRVEWLRNPLQKSRRARP